MAPRILNTALKQTFNEKYINKSVYVPFAKRYTEEIYTYVTLYDTTDHDDYDERKYTEDVIYK